MAYIKELKLTYERKRVDDDLLFTPVESADHVYYLFREMQNEAREKIVCLHLNPKLEILSYEVVAMGTAHYVISDPIEVFRGAIVVRASKIIIIHNHPAGSSKPSEADRKGAAKIRELGELHNIRLQDFMIIGEDGYFSFDEEGMFE